MKLSSRDRYLIREAFEAGYDAGYRQSSEISGDWLSSSSDLPGATIEDHLAFDADQIIED